MKITYVYMVAVCLLTLTSCYSNEVDEKATVQKLLNYNYSFLTRRSYKIENFEDSRSLTIQMSNGYCVEKIKVKYIPRILMMSLSDQFDEAKATNIYNCLSTYGFDEEKYYDLMVNAFSKFENSENVKLMYLLLFKDYVPYENNLFSLIEFNIIRCEKSANIFLHTQGYPIDPKGLMSKKEYIFFKNMTMRLCE